VVDLRQTRTDNVLLLIDGYDQVVASFAYVSRMLALVRKGRSDCVKFASTPVGFNGLYRKGKKMIVFPINTVESRANFCLWNPPANDRIHVIGFVIPGQSGISLKSVLLSDACGFRLNSRGGIQS
jgi:hypothetical protein